MISVDIYSCVKSWAAFLHCAWLPRSGICCNALRAIIKKGLRLSPLVASLSSNTVPPGGDTFNGIFIPGGTDVGYCARGVFWNKKFWGPDANEFRPERWFGVEAGRSKEMDNTMGLIFGYGKYGCLAKGVAMIELNKILVEVVDLLHGCLLCGS
jgi:cytochrome P450